MGELLVVLTFRALLRRVARLFSRDADARLPSLDRLIDHLGGRSSSESGDALGSCDQRQAPKPFGRIFIAKAERVDTTQLELEFKDKLAALDKLAGTLGIGPASDATDGKNGGSRPKPKGRRDLRQIKMPEERVEISDPAVEALVAQGEAERIGFEESAKIAWQRGGPRRLVLARVK